MKMTNIILVLTATAVALIAGLFYAYSCSVNIGLGKLNDTEYLKAMQSINRAILNPLFFSSFIGALLLLPVCTYLHYDGIINRRFLLLFSATFIYTLGTFGVTLFGNVPLNDALDKFNISTATIAEILLQRTNFEKAWNNFNTVRTIASVLSLVLVILACIISKTRALEVE